MLHGIDVPPERHAGWNRRVATAADGFRRPLQRVVCGCRRRTTTVSRRLPRGCASRALARAGSVGLKNETCDPTLFAHFCGDGGCDAQPPLGQGCRVGAQVWPGAYWWINP